MARPVPFNRFGKYGLETADVKIVDNTLTFVFNNHPYVNSPYNGELLVHFTKPAPAEATGTMPIYFETRGLTGSRKAVTKAGGVPMLAEDVTVPCYVQFFYDFRTGVVEAIASIV